ncbi:hypothetical protein UCDDS831_g00668 [Diplodia seriata]|uniref:Uncharacterized protein n=1 Tax=Diplodia seriata TaxID=420778 RepID=A0A0G2F0A3_9PEZI|nr:hypothetical protein UCDDS831_g00668 [Diplodia seriata]
MALVRCYAPYPGALNNFLEGISDERLGEAIQQFEGDKTRTVLGSGPHHNHHIDHETKSTDGWHYFSIAPNSGGTKELLNKPKGKTPYVCYIGIAAELFYDVPQGFGAIVREAFNRSRDTVNTTVTRYVLADGTICDTLGEAVAKRNAAAEKEKEKAPTHAPSGKPYWDYETMGNPSLPEHYKEYETRKPKAARKKKD